MAALAQDLTDGLSAEELRRIDLLCDESESRWKSGGETDLESIVAPAEEALQPALRQELLRVELEWRHRRGQPVRLEDYVRRFPESGDHLSVWIDEAATGAHRFGQAKAETASIALDVNEATPGDPFKSTSTATFPSNLGEYELIRPLGKGGMGEVFEARHRRLNKRVAVKLLPTDKTASRQTLERFAREMQTVGQLDHPHLLEAHDAGEEDGIVYLVLKYVDGVDLQQLVQEKGPLPPNDACELIRQAALGLQHLHEKKLVHRDIKPGNMMRTVNGQLKVIDMGLARWQASEHSDGNITQQGSALGTPDYLAPEQIEDSSDVDIRADLYGLGGTLFYLLTGQPPFAHRKDMQGKLNAHLIETPAEVTTLSRDTPKSVAKIVQRLLAKKPEERFQTPGELAEELLRLIAGLDTPARPTVEYQQSVKSFSWKPMAAIISGVAAAALAIALGVYAYYGRIPSGTVNIPTTNKKKDDINNQGKMPLRISVNKFELHHLLAVGGKDDPRGVLGRDSFTTYENDGVKISATLSEPAYCFIIAFWPNGGEELCFPENESLPPPLTDNPRYPSVSQSVSYGLTDGTGLEAFFVVVSREPLPSFKEWRAQLSESPWKKDTPTMPGVIWHYTQDELFARTVQQPSGQRGKGREIKGGGLVARTAEWLKLVPGIETVEGIGFAVLPKR